MDQLYAWKTVQEAYIIVDTYGQLYLHTCVSTSAMLQTDIACDDAEQIFANHEMSVWLTIISLHTALPPHLCDLIQHVCCICTAKLHQ